MVRPHLHGTQKIIGKLVLSSEIEIFKTFFFWLPKKNNPRRTLPRPLKINIITSPHSRPELKDGHFNCGEYRLPRDAG